MSSGTNPIFDDILRTFTLGKKALSISEISSLSGHHRHTVARYLDSLALSGKVEMRQHGQKKKYFLSDLQPESSLLNYSSHMVLILNTNLTIRWANDAFIRTVGSTFEALVNMHIEALDLEKIFGTDLIHGIRSITTGETRTLEVSLNRDDERLVYLFTISSVSFLQDRPAVVITGEDITEKKVLQDAILESEKNLRVITESVRDIIIRWNLSGTILYVSPACEILTGYVSGELIDHDIGEYIHPDDRAFLDDSLKDRINRINLPSFRFRNIRGEWIWFETMTTPRKDESGDIRDFISVWRDITDRLEAEERLARSEEKYRRLFQSAHDAIFLFQLDNLFGKPRFVEVNPAGCSMLGYTPLEFLTLNIREIIPEESLPSYREIIYEFRKHDQAFFEIDLKRRDSSVFPVEVNAHLFYLQDQPYVLAIWRDITERKKIEKEIREARMHLASILEFLPDPIFVLNRAGEVTIWNRAIEELTGVRKEEILGKGSYEHTYAFYGRRQPILADYILSRDPEILVQYDNPVTDDTLVTLDLQTQHPVTKNRIWLWIKAAPLYDLDGMISGSIEIIRDISDRKRMELEISRQKSIFESISLAGSYMLKSGSFGDCAAHTLSLIGKAALVSKVCLFENRHDEAGRDQVHLVSCWYSRSNQSSVHPLTAPGLVRGCYEPQVLQEVFRDGKTLSHLTREIGQPARGFFESEGVCSFLLVPVIISDQVYGAVGFFEQIYERKWSQREIHALEIASSLIGSAFLRFQASEELTRSEKQFRTLAQNIPGIVFRLSLADSVMEFYNDHLESVTGYSVQELSSGHFMSLIPLIYPEDKEYVVNLKRDAISNISPYEVRYRIVDKSGRIRIMVERGLPVVGEAGDVVSIDGIIQEVSGDAQYGPGIPQSP